MAGTNIELHQNPTYTCKEASRRQQLLYDSPQQQQPIYDIPQVPNEKPAVSSLVKWSILLILLIASTLLNVVTLITLFTTQVTCPQVACPQVTRPQVMCHQVSNTTETLNSSLVSSCQDIESRQPNSPSGYYHINNQFVFCEMGELCSTEGGWTRLAYLDMTDSTVDCPPGFKLYESGGVRACGRSIDNAPGCQSIKFLSNGTSYSEVCGRVVGYQYGSPDAFHTGTNDIDSYYVDGVSITQGHPRKHVWTLINGVYESNAGYDNCPCNTPSGGVQPPSFVGNDYFCESGNPDSYLSVVLYSNDTLWDGEGCGTQEGNCCAASSDLPWFHKRFTSTSEYLELRVCGSEPITNEDVPISFYELYVK